MNRFIGELDVRLIDDGKQEMWQLLAPFTYASVTMGIQVTADAGFMTDFCSVPRIPIAYWLLGNCARRAGVIHDWLYRHKIRPRQECDQLLREMVRICGLSEVESQQFYLAVRLGGESHYGASL